MTWYYAVIGFMLATIVILASLAIVIWVYVILAIKKERELEAKEHYESRST